MTTPLDAEALAVVNWLRYQASLLTKRQADAINACADAIERGDHLAVRAILSEQV